MYDYHQAMTSDNIIRQRLTVTTPDRFKEEILLRQEQHDYQMGVDVWMLPGGVPCQAIPIRKGDYREIVVLPLFTEEWYDRASKQTFVQPDIWKMCKVIAYLLNKSIRKKGVKFPRFPFVVVLDPTIRLDSGRDMIIYTPDHRITLDGVFYVAPKRIRSHSEMLEVVIQGRDNEEYLRLARITDNRKESWFWEPISYLSALRLMSVHYDYNGKPYFGLYGEVEGQKISIQMRKVSEDFGDILADNVEDYLDTEMLVRYSLRGNIWESGEDAILGGSVCGPLSDDRDLGYANRVITF